jgi:hypothetical protein
MKLLLNKLEIQVYVQVPVERFKSFGARKPTDLNRIAKIKYGYVCP